MIKFEMCEYKTVSEKICKYYYENDILIDFFFESHLIKSNFYEIKFNTEIIGYCGIYDKGLITTFNLEKKNNNLAQEIFMKVKYLEEVSEAFVPTGDEFLLSLCMDNFNRVDKQAYFTRDLNFDKGSKIGLNLRIAEVSDKELIQKHTGDFFEDIDDSLRKESLYIVEKDNFLVGFGVIEKGIIREDLQTIGMFVRDEFRKCGIGTEILKALKVIVRARNKKAISGCWYYNHNSLKTQFKSGNYCNSRLLRFKF